MELNAISGMHCAAANPKSSLSDRPITAQQPDHTALVFLSKSVRPEKTHLNVVGEEIRQETRGDDNSVDGPQERRVYGRQQPVYGRQPRDNNRTKPRRLPHEKKTRRTDLTKQLPEELRQFARGLKPAVVQENGRVPWSDIQGLEEAKNALIYAALLPIVRPAFFVGARRRTKGILLLGPPGTGKTLLARALANGRPETTFFNVTSATLTAPLLGESEKIVQTLLTLAKALSPSIVFSDKIDAICSQRGGHTEHEASRRIKSEILMNMDGITTDHNSIFCRKHRLAGHRPPLEQLFWGGHRSSVRGRSKWTVLGRGAFERSRRLKQGGVGSVPIPSLNDDEQQKQHIAVSKEDGAGTVANRSDPHCASVPAYVRRGCKMVAQIWAEEAEREQHRFAGAPTAAVQRHWVAVLSCRHPCGAAGAAAAKSVALAADHCTLNGAAAASSLAIASRSRRQSGTPNLSLGRAVRMEYRMLSDNQRARFHAALQQLKRGFGSYEYDFLHSSISMMPQEIALRAADPRVAVPYWDSALDGRLANPPSGGPIRRQLGGALFTEQHALGRQTIVSARQCFRSKIRWCAGGCGSALPIQSQLAPLYKTKPIGNSYAHDGYVHVPEPPKERACFDNHECCAQWTAKNACRTAPRYMNTWCPGSCRFDGCRLHPELPQQQQHPTASTSQCFWIFNLTNKNLELQKCVIQIATTGTRNVNAGPIFMKLERTRHN
ncbi:hypothetical protein GPALN_013243 [Globodera pallida]|nr:hypothetical protein GPALN_013243 [Globodera pallida]